jgi:hypothetical protein
MKKSSTSKPASADQAEAARIREHEKHMDAGVAAASGVSAAAVGAVIGSIAGPPGAIAGAVVGGAIGAATSITMERELHRDGEHDARLDEDIGVTSDALGAYPVKNVPAEDAAAPTKVDAEAPKKS